MKRQSTQIDTTRCVSDQVEEWLEEAALTLAALPSHGLRPSGAGSTWPDVVTDLEDLGWHRESDVMPPRPPADAVTRLDAVLTWVPLLTDSHRRLRAVVNMRLIVHPISQSHKWTWRKIGNRFGVSHHTAKAWHEEACEVIAKKITQPSFFTSQTSQFAVF